MAGAASSPTPTALAFVATLARDPVESAAAIGVLSLGLGAIALEIGPLPFDFTDYYDEEMGRPLFRAIALFRDPYDPLLLPETKRRTLEVERAGADERGRRRVNADPGYLTLRKVVLASRKDASHRLVLAEGVFAETTLAFRDGSFAPHPWTYPDYLSADVVGFFNRARAFVPR